MSFLARACIVERARRAGCADISKNFDSVAHPRSVQSNSDGRGRPRRALSRFVAMARRAGAPPRRACPAVRIRAHSKAHARTPRERSASVPRVRAAEWARWRDNRRAVDRGARHAPLLHASPGRRFQAPPCAAMCRPPCASARRLGAMRAAWALARAISRSRMKRFRAGAALRVCGAGSIFSASEATWRRPSLR